MSDILQRILVNKQTEVEQLKRETKVSSLEATPFFNRRGKSLKAALQAAEKPAIITEFKRKSPSTGDINKDASVQNVIRGYVQAGATGLSVLTDKNYFGGTVADLKSARQTTETPLLRKDFIIDEIQLFEAKANGADVILLIAEALTAEQLHDLAKTAKEIGLEVLCEIHSEEQIEKLNEYVDIVGVNNRNLANFEVNIQTSIDLAKKIPDQYVKISESGLTTMQEVRELWNAGYKGFLIGSTFMEKEQPAKAFEAFLQS